jgi:hypothetical protein
MDLAPSGPVHWVLHNILTDIHTYVYKNNNLFYTVAVGNGVLFMVKDATLFGSVLHFMLNYDLTAAATITVGIWQKPRTCSAGNQIHPNGS